MKHRLALLGASLAVLTLGGAALANPYAAAVTPSGTDGATFTLNEDADSVSLILDGGAGGTYPLPTTKGQHSFSLLGDFGVSGQHSFAIQANRNTASAWVQTSVEDMNTSFYSPLGISVNTNMCSPNFGKVYVSNAAAGTTAFGRAVQDGIYVLNPDAVDAGYFNGGYAWAGASSPFKSTIGADDRLYVADFANDLVFGFNDDLSVATQLIDASNKTTSQYVESIHVEGTQAGGDRKIYLVDSRYTDARRGLIEYNLGANATATPGDIGTQYIGPDYFGFYPRDVARDANGDWYMCQYRSDPTQAPAITKFLDSATLPINTAAWETPMTAPYSGAYGIDVHDGKGWVAYGNYYDGFVHVFNMLDGSYVGGFDAGTRLREVAFDAAGNIYTVDNITEELRIWSIGGDHQFTTTSCFLIPEPATLAMLLLGVLTVLRRR